jgi:hypothetical protein
MFVQSLRQMNNKQRCKPPATLLWPGFYANHLFSLRILDMPANKFLKAVILLFKFSLLFLKTVFLN